jgi:hypothetical protein
MAKFTYTSTEDGQVIESDERLDHLEGLARWIVEDSEAPEAPAAPEFTGDSMIQYPGLDPIAGPVNPDGKGFLAKVHSISQEEAARRQAKDLAAGTSNGEGAPEGGSAPAGAPADGGAPAGDVEIPEGEATDKWSVAQIKAFAERERIDLSEAKNKGEYLEAIDKAGVAPAGAPAEEWTIKQLEAFARREQIDLDGATLHDEIFSKVSHKE